MGWLLERARHLLVHAKNIDALRTTSGWGMLHVFAHTSDPFTMTSRRMMWLHDTGLKPDACCIVPLIDKQSVEGYDWRRFNVCSDWPIRCRERFG
jgi:hypothetical protein